MQQLKMLYFYGWSSEWKPLFPFQLTVKQNVNGRNGFTCFIIWFSLLVGTGACRHQKYKSKRQRFSDLWLERLLHRYFVPPKLNQLPYRSTRRLFLLALWMSTDWQQLWLPFLLSNCGNQKKINSKKIRITKTIMSLILRKALYGKDKQVVSAV